MKLMNEKGKLFGVINIVDLLLLLAVILVAGGIGWKVFGTTIAEVASPTTELTITARIRGAMPRQYEEIVSHGLPQQLISGTSYVDGAYITDVSYVPYVTQAVTSDGRIVNAEDPTKIDIIVTIKAEVPVGAVVTKIGTQEVREGRDHTIKTRYVEHIATVETISFANEAGDAQ